jgi:hypothetical protein
MGLVITVGAAVICGAGWFLLSKQVMHETVGDAFGEAVGVAFGVLIVVSVIGALRSFTRRAADPVASSTDSGEDPEKRS